MTIEAQLDRLNGNIETFLKLLQHIAAQGKPVTAQAPAQQPPAQAPAQQPPAQAPAFGTQNPMAPPTSPAPAAQAAQTAAPPIGAPDVQSAAPPAAPPQAQPQSDNVVQMPPAAAGPAITLDQLNQEIMAVVSQLGGNQAAASQVMQIMSSKYGTSSLRQLREDQYRPLLNDIQALVQKAGG